jgi:uncharacterized membrane protein YeaQ/YmgE (transglycosylase-associated protein family)
MTITGIITALIVGLVIGALGRLAVPGRQNIPIWLTMVIGVVAALIGTVIARALGVARTPGIDWIELLIQVVLAAVGVALVVGIGGRRHTTICRPPGDAPGLRAGGVTVFRAGSGQPSPYTSASTRPPSPGAGVTFDQEPPVAVHSRSVKRTRLTPCSFA